MITAFDYHSFCAILDDTGADNSGLKCWGSNDYCELGLGTPDSRGADPHTIGNGLEWVDLGTTAAGAKRKAIALGGGYQSTCVLGDDGAVACWGTNGSGQLGNGETGGPRSCAPGEVGDANLVSLAAPAVTVAARGQEEGDGAHACALLATGAVTCWGENSFGQLGTGDTTPLLASFAAARVRGRLRPAKLVLGNQHTCAIAADERIKCWGSNRQGQLGPDVAGDRHAPGPDLAAARPRRARARGRRRSHVRRPRGRRAQVLGTQHRRSARPRRPHQPRRRSRPDGRQPRRGRRWAVPRSPWRPARRTPARSRTTARSGAGARAARASSGKATKPARWSPRRRRSRSRARRRPSWPAPSTPARCSRAARRPAGAPARAASSAPARRRAARRPRARSRSPRRRPRSRRARGTPARCSRTARSRAGARTTRASSAWATRRTGRGQQSSRQAPRARSRRAATRRARSSTAARSGAGGPTTPASSALVMPRRAPRRRPPPSRWARGGARARSRSAARSRARCSTRRRRSAGATTGPCSSARRSRRRRTATARTRLGDFLPEAAQGGGRSLRGIAAGRAHACAILDTDDVRCWGDNGYGQLGAGDGEAHSPLLHPTGVVDLGRSP